MAKRHTLESEVSPLLTVIDEEIDLLYMRASLLRRGMLSVALSALLSALLVAVSVGSRFFDVDLAALESVILVAATLLIVLSALFFSSEISVSLKALSLAVANVPSPEKKEA